MSNVVKLTPKPSQKAKSGDPGTVTTSEGDVMVVGQCSDVIFKSLQFEEMQFDYNSKEK